MAGSTGRQVRIDNCQLCGGLVALKFLSRGQETNEPLQHIHEQAQQKLPTFSLLQPPTVSANGTICPSVVDCIFCLECTNPLTELKLGPA